MKRPGETSGEAVPAKVTTSGPADPVPGDVLADGEVVGGPAELNALFDRLERGE